MKKLLPLLVLVPFTLFSVEVAYQHGPVGFLGLALREPWAMQLFLDLSIALVFVGGWMVKDAKKHGINPYPYVALLPFLGSIGALIYVVRRSFVASPVTVAA